MLGQKRLDILQQVSAAARHPISLWVISHKSMRLGLQLISRAFFGPDKRRQADRGGP